MPSSRGPQDPRACRAPVAARRTRALTSALAGALAVTLSATFTLAAAPAHAAPPAAPAPTQPTTTIAGAQESGDLGSARDLAVAAREADPSAATWKAEAEAHEALADYERAIKAWKAHRKALPEDASDAHEAASARIEALQERSRGAVADEPASTHRDELDQARAARIAALRPKPAPPKPAPKPPPPREKIIKKWYFWVTVAAIAASAGAITGIAIKAAREEQADDLDPRAGPLPASPGGFVVRF